MRAAWVCAVLLCALLSSAQATLYEYTDENGVPRVVDNLSKVPEAQKEKLRSIAAQKMPPPDEAYLARKKASAENAKRLSQEAPAEQPSTISQILAAAGSPVKKVEIYVKSWCPYCKQALNLLSSKGVRYMSYDVETDSAAYERFKSLGGSGVPLLVIGSQVLHGYSADEILNALD